MQLPTIADDDLDDLSPYARELALLPLTAGRHSTVVAHGQWRSAVASYLACIHFVDDLLGNLIDALDRSPHADNTWVVLFSDHGYHLGEKQHWGKFTPWSRSTRVPLILVPPKGDPSAEPWAGSVVDEAVSLVDLYPTLVDVCGIESPDHRLDGGSLREYFTGVRTDRAGTSSRVAITSVGRGTYSIVSKDHRYIRYFDGSEELYDRKADPHEWHNLAADPAQQGVKAELAKHVPEDPEVSHLVRYGDWKAVLFKDASQDPLLYPIAAGTGGGGGIGETKSVAKGHPDVIAEIQRHIAEHPPGSKCLIIEPAEGKPSRSGVSPAEASRTRPQPRDPVDELAAAIEPDRQMVYKNVDGRELSLHVLEPEGWRPDDRRPCFLIIHGGGWTGGNARRMYPFADHFRRLGMVGISIEYRLHDPRNGTTVFDCAHDAQDAYRFVADHASDLGIDPGKIVVSGGSAGGHLAAGTVLFDGAEGTKPIGQATPLPAALVLLFPVIDTSKAGYGQAKIGERWRELSPVHRVRGPVPPTLIFHGTGDTVTPFAGAVAFREAMERQGNRCELDVHEGGKHGYLMFERRLYLQTLERTESFLQSLGLLPVN